MCKDPYQLEETPYEFLGVSPDAGPKEIQAALPRFLRDTRNIARFGPAQQANKKLRTPAERALVDIWFYNVETASEQAGPEVDMAEALAGFLKVPCYPVEELYSDLTGLDLSKEQRAIEFKEMRIDDLKRY